MNTLQPEKMSDKHRPLRIDVKTFQHCYRNEHHYMVFPRSGGRSEPLMRLSGDPAF